MRSAPHPSPLPASGARGLIVALFLTASAFAQAPKNIILVIGDGMGAGQVTALRWLRGDKTQFLRMPHSALVATHCADEAVTDSAASASAYAIGQKVNYHAVSVTPGGESPRTVLEIAHASGKATGLVTTTNFWDATPAAFAAHAKERYDEAPSILRQMVASGADVIIGGGIDSLGKDNLPPLEELKKSDREVVTSLAELQAAKSSRVLAITKRQDNDLEDPNAPLAALAAWALERLSKDPDGFFLMIENEGIDSSSHTNYNPHVRRALETYDDVLRIALDFAAARNDTLVIAVGDHETGGMRIFQTRDRKRWRMEWSTVEHTGTAIPLFAFGRGAEAFHGFLDNTDVGKKLLGFAAK